MASDWTVGGEMLEIRPNCERCDVDLPPGSPETRISYECTFCAACAVEALRDVCPNCGGGFAPRPIRPAGEWRPGTGLAFDPPSTARRALVYPSAEVETFVARLAEIAPALR